MSRILITLSIFAAFAALSLSFPQELADNLLSEIIESNVDQLKDQQIGIPTIEIIKALEEQHQFPSSEDSPTLDRSLTMIQNKFNLSAYLNTNRPNGTAVTFVPLITLLLGIFGAAPAVG